MTDIPKKPTSEEEYFHRKEQELKSRLRQKAQAETERRGLAEAVGIENEKILDVLKEMGFDRETVRLLFLVPILQVAWSDGSLSAQERALILEAARLHGIVEGHAAHARLQKWLEARPGPEVFNRALRVIRELMSFQQAGSREELGRKLVDACQRVAAASGGFLGLGSKTSSEEKAVLQRVSEAIESAHADAAHQVLGHLKD
jgi:DnaJ-domain-containing protein 1